MLSSMLRFSSLFSLGIAAGACALIGACSLLNAPADVIPGTGGGGSTSTGAPCVHDGDCAPTTVPCKKSVCAAGGACQLVPVADATMCDDGLYCTVSDACRAGVCEGTPRPCPDQDACNVGQCDEA